jgi:T5SS/PEP-CTERM-associated repeat protein
MMFKTKCLAVAAMLALVVTVPPTVCAQYSLSFQTNIISGVINNWASDYLVGSNTFADVLLVQASGVLSNRNGYVGYASNSWSNQVVVAGVGSLWYNSGSLSVGYNGFANNLVISNGGRVYNKGTFYSYIGYNSGGNSVLVSDPGSVWTNDAPLMVGDTGSGNLLVISNGGYVVTSTGYMGDSFSNTNRVLVADPGSEWRINGGLYLGWLGVGNSVVISNGGQVIANYCYIDQSLYSSNNTVLVTGAGSVFSNSNTLIIGTYGQAESVVISNGGRFVNGDCQMAVHVTSVSNTVVVTGPNSVWDNTGALTIGEGGPWNRVVITNESQVFSDTSVVGESNSNIVVVTGSGSVWSNSEGLTVGDEGESNNLAIDNGGHVYSSGTNYIGYGSGVNRVTVTGTGSLWQTESIDLGVLDTFTSGSGNSLVISNSGQVIDDIGYVGGDTTGSSNTVLLASSGLWQNNAVYIGNGGKSNLVWVTGGSVLATNLVVGFAAADCGNLLQVDSGYVIVTNPVQDAVLEVRQGQLVLNGGTIQVNTLVMTNACASLVHTGGTLIAGNVILSPNAFRITSVTPQGNDVRITWLMGPGQTNALQVAAGDGNGGYSTNGFADIFVVTNNPTAGTATNYLDAGGATNVPARYYRVRLAP